MTLASAPVRISVRPARAVWVAGLLIAGAAALGAAAWAQNPAPVQPPQRVALKGGSSWSELTPAQRTALAPLQREWNDIGPEQRAKWLQVAARYPSMSEAERERMQARMAAWSRMSPQERGQTRLRYQQAQTVPPQERQERWEQYQALPAEQRRQLANRSASKSDPTPARKPEVRAGNGAARATGREGGAQPKSNLVPNPSYAASPKAVAPTIVQAKPGATTNLISKPPKPPGHQQTGLPKIAATPGFVDSTTLLPQRGPQGAATRPKVAPGEADKRQ